MLAVITMSTSSPWELVLSMGWQALIVIARLNRIIQGVCIVVGVMIGFNFDLS